MQKESKPIFTIRQATPDDLEILTNLRVDFFAELGGLTSAEQVAAFRDATFGYLSKALLSGDFLAWVAEGEGRIVGTSGLVFFEQAPTPQNLSGLEGYILNMYTLPAWRGRGIARRLLQTVIAYVEQTSASQIWLYTTRAGRPVYEKEGFVALHTAMKLRLLSRHEDGEPKNISSSPDKV